MAVTVSTELLKHVKTHLRVTHTMDDDIIKNEIIVSYLDIYEMYMLIPKMIQDPNFSDDETKKIINPAYSDKEIVIADLDPKILSAICHYVAMLRTNPDERIEIQAGRTTTTSRLIERILGSLRTYHKVM